MTSVVSSSVRRLPAPEIHIDVRASRSHVGKTHIAELIRRALDKYGLEAEVVCQDGDIEKFAGRDITPGFERLKELGLKVKIFDNNERIKNEHQS